MSKSYSVHHAHPNHSHVAVEANTLDPLDLAYTAEDQGDEAPPQVDDYEPTSTVDHVESDEVHFGHRKNETGARVAQAGQHIFQTMVVVNIQGKICDFVMRPIADKSAATLQSWIRENVPPRTVVATDCWKGYIGLNDDFVHTTVNHSDKRHKFVNPVNGTTTNCVEFMHRLIKAQLAKRGGRLGHATSERIARIMAHGTLAAGSLQTVDGDRRHYIFRCLREVIVGGWPLWEAVAETGRVEAPTQELDTDTDRTPIRGRRTDTAQSPTVRDPTLLMIGWPRDLPLPAGAVILPSTYGEDRQDPAAGEPRTPLFARNLAAAAARATAQPTRGRGRPRTRPVAGTPTQPATQATQENN